MIRYRENDRPAEGVNRSSIAGGMGVSGSSVFQYSIAASEFAGLLAPAPATYTCMQHHHIDRSKCVIGADTVGYRLNHIYFHFFSLDKVSERTVTETNTNMDSVDHEYSTNTNQIR